MKLFKKPKSKFYWYDFTVRSRRFRGSTQETKSVKALQIASLKLASVMETSDRLPTKPPVLQEFADRFLDWVKESRLEEKTRKFYRNGWRLLTSTSVAMLRVDHITSDCADQLRFPGSAANANCALRTLRRMLHKAEEWKVIGHAPKIKMMRFSLRRQDFRFASELAYHSHVARSFSSVRWPDLSLQPAEIVPVKISLGPVNDCLRAADKGPKLGLHLMS